jgi:hypothetical protein
MGRNDSGRSENAHRGRGGFEMSIEVQKALEMLKNLIFQIISKMTSMHRAHH